MSLKSRISSQFNPKIRDRGVAYFRSGSVAILEHSKTHVKARVSGTLPYLVNLSLKRNNLLVACTCPFFDRGEECKHVWATILAADNQNYLSDADLSGPMRLVWDDDIVEELLNELEHKKSESAPLPAWQNQLTKLTSTVKNARTPIRNPWPDDRQLFYVVDPDVSRRSDMLGIEIAVRERKRNGEWTKLKRAFLRQDQLPRIPDARDRKIVALLAGAKNYYWSAYNADLPNPFVLPNPLQDLMLEMMCGTERCVLRSDDKNLQPQRLQWDDSTIWRFWLVVRKVDDAYSIQAVLRSEAREIDFSAALMTTDTIVIDPQFRAARFDSHGASTWTRALRESGELQVPASEARELVSQLVNLPKLPNLELPDELKFERVAVPARPHLIIRKPEFAYFRQPQLEAKLLFDYEGSKVDYFDARDGVYDPEHNRYVERSKETEERAYSLLHSLGVRKGRDYQQQEKLQLTARRMPAVVSTLLDQGWKVEAEGKLYRNPGMSSLSVSSGIDWFELHGTISFGEGFDVTLPKLLAALRRGESVIALGDGSFGVLPQEWLQRYGLLASLGTSEEDHLRFQRTQTGVLDALLAARPEISCDETFERVRDEWRRFEGIEPINEPRGFVGKLRDYQRDGLGWFSFLERFNFGGCLADDMGLGKTVQVLALLESRRNGKPTPSLVVVPRSLIFNWQQEAARFTPKLRVLSHTGAERVKGSTHFENYDLILTTYGTLRRDVVHFNDVEFDFVILDEAQAIKNAGTETAKAARLLKSNHRLALSGTPIENHLGELWSLFEFLNPGMLGASSVFQSTTNGSRAADLETRTMLSRALRPFLLRRTKQQVATELPEKLEQTIYCEMDDRQRKQYEELRDYYRKSLIEKVSLLGINKSKIQILEALLRLRQTACHPSLVSGDVDDVSPNAKLDTLLPRLVEVIEEGHKAIVFSQFTSFLAIVRRRLDAQGIDYVYLDGKTRNRGEVVEKFQNDPHGKLFLISLKAGGHGLNLTAAEYVFLLDPWWNPAVEAQAIDRAHRIGQTNRVFAYRLITRDTVEEKVLELQSTKRDLADAIINADNSLIKNITGEDLSLLLS